MAVLHEITSESEHTDTFAAEILVLASKSVSVRSERHIHSTDLSLSNIIEVDSSSHAPSIADSSFCGETPFASNRIFETWDGVSKGQAVVIKMVKKRPKPTSADHETTGADLLSKDLLSRTHTWSRVKHRNVLDIIGITATESSLGLITPNLKNGNLIAFLDRNPHHDRLKSITEISAGLTYLHAHNPPIVHGNIKGSNIVVSDDFQCLITDLDLPISPTPTPSPISSAAQYTSIRWRAPELFHQPPSLLKYATPQDVFSFSLTILEIITGQDPFSSEIPLEPAVAVAIARGRRPRRPLHPREGWCPDYVWDLVEKCWVQAPEDRPQVAEVYEYLKGVAEKKERSELPLFELETKLSSKLVVKKKVRTFGGATVLEEKRIYPPREIFANLFKLACRQGSDIEPSLVGHHVLRPGAVHGILQSQRFREKLYEILHHGPFVNATEIYQAVLSDEDKMAGLVEIVMKSKLEMVTLLELPEDDMNCVMNVLQDLLDNHDSAFIDRLRQRIRCLLVKLSKKATKLPETMFMSGVAPVQQRTVCSGAFGDVFRSSYGGDFVALKRLRFFRGADHDQGKLCRKFCKEAMLWKRLNHRFVLPLLGIDADTFPRQPCMVSPWMFNGTAIDYLRNTPMGADELDVLLFEVIQGIEYLHSQGVVHGDIKGANILIDKDGHPRLADFGLTCFNENHNASNTSDYGGTLRWMAPELFFGEKTKRTFASDVYAFGCVCIELYTGRPPFQELTHDLHVLTQVYAGERPSRPSRMSDAMWELVNRCWRKENDSRPSSSKIVVDMEKIVRTKDRN